MENKFSKSATFIFSILISLILLLTIIMVYNKYLINRDFLLFGEVECDPKKEKCFIKECFPEEDPRCLGRTEVHYKIIQKMAYDTPPLNCSLDEADCILIYCTDEIIAELEIDSECSIELVEDIRSASEENI